MSRAIKKAAAKLVTDWVPCTTPPVRDGDYEYRSSTPEPGGKPWGIYRGEFKDGKWFSAQVKPISMRLFIDECPHCFEWRGVRRWVLVRINDRATGDRSGKPNGSFLVCARPKQIAFDTLRFARPFLTQRAAQRFADRYAHLGLTAVLP